MRETPLYQGAQYKEANRPQAELPRLSLPESPFARVLPQAVKTAEQALHNYAEVKDYQKQLESAKARKVNEESFKTELRRRANLPWGSKDSVYNADGTTNEEALTGLVMQYQEKNLATRANCWLRKNNIRDEEGLSFENEMLSASAISLISQQELRNLERSFRDTFELMEVKGDRDGAYAAVAGAVQRGIITPQKGEAMKLRMAKRAVASAGSFRSEGQILTGVAAQFAASVARSGYKAPQAQSAKPASGADSQAENKRVLGVDAGGGLSLQEEDSGADGLTATETGGSQAFTLTPADHWLQGDDAAVVKTFSNNEFGAYSLSLNPSVSLSEAEQDDGSTIFTCAPGSSDAMQRVTAQANADKEITYNSAVSAVSEIAADTFASNPDAEISDVVSQFKGSSIASTLGNGDPEVGEVRIKAIAAAYRRSMVEEKDKVRNDEVDSMISTSFSSSDKFRNQRWRKMEKLANLTKEGEEYEFPEEGTTKQKNDWYAMFEAYKSLRDAYNPMHPEGDASKEEFAEKAPGFYKWYMEDSGLYQKERNVNIQSAKAWYKGQIALNRLQRTRGFDEKTGERVIEGYSSDVDLIKGTLNQDVPDEVFSEKGAEKLGEMYNEIEAEKMKRAEKYRDAAGEAYAALRENKKSTAIQEEEEKAKKKKKLSDEEVRAKAAQARESMTIRSSEWGFDGNTAPEEARVPSCTIPESFVAVMREKMGFDKDLQLPFLVIGSTKIPITGTNSSGKILLNMAAATKCQPPNRKKNEPLLLQGQVKHSFYFKDLSK